MVTNSPVTDYDDRNVLDAATLTLSAKTPEAVATLKGHRGGAQIIIRSQIEHGYMKTTIDTLQDGRKQRSTSMRLRRGLGMKALWIGESYMHLDSGRSCFSPSVTAPGQRPDSAFWFATLSGPNTPVPQSRDAFEIRTETRYKLPASGSLSAYGIRSPGRFFVNKRSHRL